MWVALVQLGIWAGLYIANYLMRPKEPKPKPLTKDNITLPRTEEGSVIPVVFGRYRVTAPGLIWTGPLQTKTVSVGGGQVISYGMNMLFAVGIPMPGAPGPGSPLSSSTPKLHAVWYGDKRLPGRRLPGGTLSNVRWACSVTRRDFLGGPGNGGGIFGTYEWHWGSADQTLSGPIAAALALYYGDATKVPKYRNQMVVGFLNHYGNEGSLATRHYPDGAVQGQYHPQAWSFGESGNVDGFSFEPATYGSGDPTVTTMQSGGFGYEFGGDADPAMVLYVILTSSWSCIGLDPSVIDKPSFLAASATLKAENHGFSFAFSDPDDGVGMLSTVLAQINAALYEDPETGKIVLALIREESTVGIPHFQGSSIHEIEDYGIGAWRDAINEVRVTYTDRAREYKPAIAIARSAGNASSNANRRSSKEIEYLGCTRAELAAKLAARDLHMLSQPLKKIAIVVDRSGYKLRPGKLFRVTYPEYGIAGTVFRCQTVDLGQLHANEVTIEAVADAFATSYVGQPADAPAVEQRYPRPIAHKLITEAPYYLAWQAKSAGIVSDESTPRLAVYAAASTNTELVSSQSRITGTANLIPDQMPYEIPMSFVLDADYAREWEPYDTVHGLSIRDVRFPYNTAGIEDLLTGSPATAGQIFTYGRNLICVVSGDVHEYMAYESASTADGGVTYTLHNVHRGLFCTPAIKHLEGAHGFMVSSLFGYMVGRLSYQRAAEVDCQVIPYGNGHGGSGDDLIEQRTIRARPWLPRPIVDMRIAGERVLGTAGLPAVAGHMKTVSRLEEGFEIYGRTRARVETFVNRGDNVDTTDFTSAVVHKPFAYQAAEQGAGLQGYGLAFTDGGLLTHVSGALAGGVLLDGYGLIYVEERSQRTVQGDDPALNRDGISLNDVLDAWDAPMIEVMAYECRNLMGNPRYRYAGGLTPWWPTASVVLESDASFSLTRTTAGKYLGVSASATTMEVAQTVPIGNWLPRGMTAIVWAYHRNADGTTTTSLRADALNAGGVSLANAATVVSAPSFTNWEYREKALAIPANATQLRWKTIMTDATQLRAKVSDSGIALGQIYNGTLNLLTNSSFESGSTASWTNQTNSMVTATAIARPSATYAQGGAFATSQICQDFTLPAGYEVGCYLVMRCFRAQTIAGDAGAVTLEARNGGGALANDATGDENIATLNEWTERLLIVEVPAGSTVARVTLKATRTGGAGNSGACFDEVRLSLHKRLTIAFERVFDYSSAAMSVQPQPESWQQYARDYPELPDPIAVISAQALDPSAENPVTPIEVDWSDTDDHPNGRLPGFWGDRSWVTSFVFERESGGLASCVEAMPHVIDSLAAFDYLSSFTVLCYFRIDELPWSGVECGLVGRRDSTAGWALNVNSLGTIEGVIQGLDGEVAAGKSGTVVDGALHMGALVFDADAETLTVYSERGAGAPISTVGVGEFLRLAQACRLRVGRSSSSGDSMTGMMGSIYIFKAALTAQQIASHWTYATAPIAATYTRNVPAWTQLWDDTEDEALLVSWATDQLAYTSEELNDHGLALAKANTNRIPSWDFTGASWVADAGATITHGLADNTGQLAGVTADVDTTNGLKVIGVTATATTTLRLVFWARANSVLGVTIELMNASDVIKNSQGVALDSLNWKRYVVAFTGWDNSTPTMRLRWRATSGSSIFQLSHVIWAQEGADVPYVYPGPLASMSDVTLSRAESIPRQFNSEGEIEMELASLRSTPTATASLVTVWNGVSNHNRREITANSSGQAIANHYDATGPTNVTSTATAFDWTGGFLVEVTTVRARWCRAMLLDNAVSPYAGIVTSGTSNSAVYGRTATFSENATQATLIEVNKGAAAGANILLRKLTVRARESKLA
jgi:hypothetical protein